MKRLDVRKTYKMYVDGSFPRTESGRHYPLLDAEGNIYAHMCLGSRKDVRNAVVGARKGLGQWKVKTAFNRSQILYRLGEMMEGRKGQLAEELMIHGLSQSEALLEVEKSIDLVIHYSGWCDKYGALLSSVNPVASSHFNFSVCEPMGLVAFIAPEKNALLGLLTGLLPIITGGNSCVLLASESKANVAITLSEIIHSSDFNAGCVQVLTGQFSELIETFASHKDINALLVGKSVDDQSKITALAAENLKRLYLMNLDEKLPSDSLRMIELFQEIKTTWHPIEQIENASAGY
jgi:acyl-CoA reductase-like NAD-dependent aldehyde dehydrogenase